MRELKQTEEKVKHLYRIVEIQTFYRKYKGAMRACRPTVESEDKFFDSYNEAEVYLKDKRTYNHWIKTNERTDDPNWNHAYYEIIDDHSCVLRWTDCKNYRIISWNIVDFYMSENEYENYKDVRHSY